MRGREPSEIESADLAETLLAVEKQGKTVPTLTLAALRRAWVEEYSYERGSCVICEGNVDVEPCVPQLVYESVFCCNLLPLFFE